MRSVGSSSGFASYRGQKEPRFLKKSRNCVDAGGSLEWVSIPLQGGQQAQSRGLQSWPVGNWLCFLLPGWSPHPQEEVVGKFFFFLLTISTPGVVLGGSGDPGHTYLGKGIMPMKGTMSH